MDSKLLETRQHNAITNARYEYSEMQLDIFLYLLSGLRKDKADGIYEISVPAMTRLTGKKYNYKKLRESTADMGSRCFEIPNAVNKAGQTVWRQLWMFKRIDYIEGTGVIEVEFNEFMSPYLFDLKDNFTSFQLYSALRLGSKHAKRIYTLCSQWKDKELTPKYDIQEFKNMLGLVDKMGNEGYGLFSMFKKRVLDESVRQINEYTDLQVSYALEKKGRSFNSVVFHVKPQPLAVILPIKNDSSNELPVGISDSQYQNARLLLDKWGIKRPDVVNQIMNTAEFVQEVNRFAYELQTGKVKVDKNIAGYLLTKLGLKQPKVKEDKSINV